MTADPILRTRIHLSLDREVNTIYREMDDWKAECDNSKISELNKHKRQLERIRGWTNSLALRQAVDELASLSPDDFPRKTLALQTLVAGAREAWEFYRDRFGLYFMPLRNYKQWIAGAEWVAADCYKTAMRSAQLHRLLPDASEIPDSPLMQLENALTPQKGPSMPLVPARKLYYPIRIIILPADLLANSWGFLAIHHEVGHVVDGDLAEHLHLPGHDNLKRISAIIADKLVELLCQRKIEGVVGKDRVCQWQLWTPELFADFFAILSAGPAFVGHMIDTLALAPAEVFKMLRDYPPHYLRVLLLVRFVETMEDRAARRAGRKRREAVHKAYGQCADGYRRQWRALYTDDKSEDMDFETYLNLKQYSHLPSLDAYLRQDEMDAVIEGIVDTTFAQAYSGREVTLRDLGTFDSSDFDRIKKLVDNDLAKPHVTDYRVELVPRLAPRLAPSAARLAFEQLTSEQSKEKLPLEELSQRLEELRKRIEQLNEQILSIIDGDKEIIDGDKEIVSGKEIVLGDEGAESAVKSRGEEVILQARAQRFREAVLQSLSGD